MEATRLLTDLQRQVQSSDQIAASPAYLDDPDYIEEYQKIRKICSSRYARTRELKKRTGLYISLLYVQFHRQLETHKKKILQSQ